MSTKDYIYFDNAATSWPKPDAVINAMNSYMREIGASPGRSGHTMAVDASRIVFETREAVADFFNVPDSANVVFTASATHALNIAIKGILNEGDHVIVSALEHNSVMRPLRQLEEERQISVSILSAGPDGSFDPDKLYKTFRPNTRLAVINHGSNVTGSIAPLAAIGALCREHSVPLLVDTAQTAGAVPLNMVRDNIDLLAFSGHKALLGPQGTGGLCINSDLEIRPLLTGGSGSQSEHDQHPNFMPDRLEAGTQNAVGLAGLLAGLNYLANFGLKQIRATEQALVTRLLTGLSEIKSVNLYGPGPEQMRLPVISFNIEGKQPSQVGLELDQQYGIMCRIGLHCAPNAHRAVGTFPAGTVRLSPGYFNTPEQVDKTLEAVRKIAERKS
ncbi:aminotransferase class V-fold PLP-dependent enzyme [Candidatus Margulisiibacteriota bacterium]